jgi:predicted enzyme related to lactoylglutathione lyase
VSALRSTRDVIVRASDIAAAKRFYHEVMGFPITTEQPALLGFDTGSFTLYVERGTEDATPVFDFEHDGMQENKARLVAAGCEIVEVNPAIPRCYLRDPFGLVFNLAED